MGISKFNDLFDNISIKIDGLGEDKSYLHFNKSKNDVSLKIKDERFTNTSTELFASFSKETEEVFNEAFEGTVYEENENLKLKSKKLIENINTDIINKDISSTENPEKVHDLTMKYYLLLFLEQEMKDQLSEEYFTNGFKEIYDEVDELSENDQATLINVLTLIEERIMKIV